MPAAEDCTSAHYAVDAARARSFLTVEDSRLGVIADPKSREIGHLQRLALAARSRLRRCYGGRPRLVDMFDEVPTGESMETRWPRRRRPTICRCTQPDARGSRAVQRTFVVSMLAGLRRVATSPERGRMSISIKGRWLASSRLRNACARAGLERPALGGSLVVLSTTR